MTITEFEAISYHIDIMMNKNDRINRIIYFAIDLN